MEPSKRVLGEEHPSTLMTMGNLALMYWNQGRWKEAEVLQALVTEEVSFRLFSFFIQIHDECQPPHPQFCLPRQRADTHTGVSNPLTAISPIYQAHAAAPRTSQGEPHFLYTIFPSLTQTPEYPLPSVQPSIHSRCMF